MRFRLFAVFLDYKQKISFCFTFSSLSFSNIQSAESYQKWIGRTIKVLVTGLNAIFGFQPPFFPSLSPIVISHFAYLRPYPCHYNKLEFPLHPCPCRDYESTVHSLVPFMLMRYVLYYIFGRFVGDYLLVEV